MDTFTGYLFDETIAAPAMHIAPDGTINKPVQTALEHFDAFSNDIIIANVASGNFQPLFDTLGHLADAGARLPAMKARIVARNAHLRRLRRRTVVTLSGPPPSELEAAAYVRFFLRNQPALRELTTSEEIFTAGAHAELPNIDGHGVIHAITGHLSLARLAAAISIFQKVESARYLVLTERFLDFVDELELDLPRYRTSKDCEYALAYPEFRQDECERSLVKAFANAHQLFAKNKKVLDRPTASIRVRNLMFDDGLYGPKSKRFTKEKLRDLADAMDDFLRKLEACAMDSYGGTRL